jgi:hypothetical protein
MRFTSAVVAWLGLAAAALFVFRSEQQLNTTRTAARTFDQRAREAVATLTDLRAAQEAYVAAGQGVAYWMPKVTATSEAASAAVSGLAETATAGAARVAAGEASKALSEFVAADKRARDYINSEQELMAADVIFTEGTQTIAAAAQQLELARLAEREAQDRAEADARKLEAAVAGAAALVAALIVLALAPRPKSVVVVDATAAAAPAATTPDDVDSLLLRVQEQEERRHAAAPAALAAAAPAAAAPALEGAAELCTALARVRDAADLAGLLARAADLLDASGIIVWLGSVAGDDLRPALAHGYPPHIVSKMPPVARSADNAAARAYRTGEMQIVAGRPGAADGALVAPLVGADGIFGALTLEFRHGAEASHGTQSLAAIFAALLSAISGGTPAEETTGPRAASGHA